MISSCSAAKAAAVAAQLPAQATTNPQAPDANPPARALTSAPRPKTTLPKAPRSPTKIFRSSYGGFPGVPMKLYKSFLTAAALLISLARAQQQTSQETTTIQDPGQLVGKRVDVQRLPLCQPGTYMADFAHSGKRSEERRVGKEGRSRGSPDH